MSRDVATRRQLSSAMHQFAPVVQNQGAAIIEMRRVIEAQAQRIDEQRVLTESLSDRIVTLEALASMRRGQVETWRTRVRWLLKGDA